VIVSSCKALEAIYPDYRGGSPLVRAKERLEAFWRTQTKSKNEFSSDTAFVEPGMDHTYAGC